MPSTAEDDFNLIALTADIVSAHVAANSVVLADVPRLITGVHDALAGLGSTPVPDAEPQKPAVSVRASVKHDHIVCLEDGKKLKMLKRHLMSHYGLTPDAYRAKWTSLPTIQWSRQLMLNSGAPSPMRSALAAHAVAGRKSWPKPRRQSAVESQSLPLAENASGRS